MYFETIHNLSDFEEVHCPEEGYSSCWETETEFDSELGHLIFHNVTGDSASVICIDEAMDLLALREQQEQQMEHTRRQESADGAEFAELTPGGFEEFSLDQQLEQHSDTKRSGGASRHSHHSGSDGTYDGPQQTPIHTTHIVAESEDQPEEHIYETLDNCQEHYEMYVSKGSDGSGNLMVKPSSHVSVESDKSSGAKRTGNSKSSSFRAIFGKSRSMSQSTEHVSSSEKRKDSKRQGSFERRERGAQVAPKQYPPPIRGYAMPTSPAKRSASDKKVATSPTGTSSTHDSVAPSLVIKHKGKTYLIPVIEKKREGKAKQQSSKRVHNVLYTTSQPSMPRSASTAFASSNAGSRRHASPPQAELCDGTASSRKRKGHQQSNISIAQTMKQSSASSNKVTHYGML